ncbi:MAG: alanine dehydrogenase, partial [Saprospiraceae bacterium]|nr:alanine dehydrogenase [Saprospiraceae bacterium]
MSLLSVGVFGTSSKENEKRVPIHPDQIEWIDEQVREKLTFEQGYGHHFGIDDEQIAAQVGGMAPREDLFRNCDVLLLPKPVQADFDAMPEGAILWGWP